MNFNTHSEDDLISANGAAILSFSHTHHLLVAGSAVMVPVVCSVIDKWTTREGSLIIKVHTRGPGIDREDSGGQQWFNNDLWSKAMRCMNRDDDGIPMGGE